MTGDDATIVPTHLQIETINGACTARCTMCTIRTWTRTPRTMPENDFRVILEKFVPYLSQLDFLTLHGCGEPLLDHGLPEKIATAKKLGFRGTGFATNGTELKPVLSRRLIESGLDTIICSVDGIRRETHEAIRLHTNFRQVVDNVKQFIRLRDEMCGKTRVLVRFIRQKLNYQEWPDFYQQWISVVSPEKGDDVIRFDMHNWGRTPAEYTAETPQVPGAPLICSDLFERFFIYSNGRVGLCCADDNGFFELGSVLEEDPIQIYNREPFSTYRESMREGRIRELKFCRNCTIPNARSQKTKPRVIRTG
jgi:hypothetical protein